MSNRAKIVIKYGRVYLIWPDDCLCMGHGDPPRIEVRRRGVVTMHQTVGAAARFARQQGMGPLMIEGEQEDTTDGV